MTRTPTSLRANDRGSAESEDESPDSQNAGKEEKTPSRGRKGQAPRGPEDVEMEGIKA